MSLMVHSIQWIGYKTLPKLFTILQSKVEFMNFGHVQTQWAVYYFF